MLQICCRQTKEAVSLLWFFFLSKLVGVPLSRILGFVWITGMPRGLTLESGSTEYHCNVHVVRVSHTELCDIFYNTVHKMACSFFLSEITPFPLAVCNEQEMAKQLFHKVNFLMLFFVTDCWKLEKEMQSPGSFYRSRWPTVPSQI